MTPAKLAEYVRFKTRTNSTTLTNADLVILANVVKDRLTLSALELDEDLFLVPTYMDLKADQREYPLLSTILSRIKRVEAKLDGTNWLKLFEFDLTSYKNPVTPESNITYNFSNDQGSASFDMMRKSIIVYSGTITEVTDGLRIWVNTWPEDISDMTSTTDMSIDPSNTTHGFPRELHGVLSTGMILEWKGSREKPLPLDEHEANYEMDVRRAIQSLKGGNYDRVVQGSIPEDYGEDY
jgi:hypothetical protein